MTTEKRAATFDKGWHLGTLEVDLAIEGHEQLHSLELVIIRRERKTVVNEFVGKIFDGVTEDLKRVAGLGGDDAAARAQPG